jgi:hypothetical protein
MSPGLGVFVPMVEIGDVGMAVHEHFVPVRVLMAPDHLLRMDMVVVGVVVDVFVVVLHWIVMVLVEMG